MKTTEKLSWTLAVLALAGCGATRSNDEGGLGEECENVLDCGPGLACVDGTCADPLDGTTDATLDSTADGSPDAPPVDGTPEPDAGPDGAVDTAGDGAGDAADVPDAPADVPDAPADVPGDAVEELCMFRPPVAGFSPRMECTWNGSETAPTKVDVVATPAVANLTDDNGDTLIDLSDVPDIAVVTYDLLNDGCCDAEAVLRVLSGRCDAGGDLPEHYTVTDPPLDNSSAPAVGDIDGDTLPEIVAARHLEGTVAFEHDGTQKWRSEFPSRGESDTCIAYQPTLADLDSDGIVEVVAGRVVLDGLTGEVRWRGLDGRGFNAFMGPISVVADIDLDTIPEVVAGNTAYEAHGWVEWVYDYGSSLGSCQTACGLPCDGYNAIGDFDDDPYAEVVVTVAERVFVLEHDGTLKTMVEIPREGSYGGHNEGGPPTIADFDGDTRPEIGVAAANYYVVVDLDCTEPLPGDCESEGIRWSIPNNDESSRATGSSVFDFEGDGVAEVVYNDETDFRILRGTDGEVLFEWDNYSHTRLEYPVIADVDDDGNAEILFIENSNGEGDDPGLELWGDEADTWVPTRRIWNQHAYHITNVHEDGTVPLVEENNWFLYNNYRQNLPDFSPFLAPDLTVSLEEVDTTPCSDHVDLVVLVCNEGDLRVGAGVQVSFTEGDPASGTPIACEEPAATTTTLDPDECELVTCSWSGVPLSPESADVTACVDDADGSCSAPGENNECNEDNNKVIIEDVQCDIIG